MEAVNLILLVLLAAELFMILSNLSKLRGELSERQEKLTSELSEIKKSLEK
jgi:hypothetical protein